MNQIITLFEGDCLVKMKDMPDSSIDSVVCDPPYLIDFMNKNWDSTTVDPAFGHYIAGLVDGEGCFRIHKAHGGMSSTYTCEFQIKLRDDDARILNEIQRALGVGRLHEEKGDGVQKPQLKFIVSKLQECRKVQRFFESFPLRAKKQKDFVHWCKHLDLWEKHTRGADKTALIESYEEMKEVRSYENTKAPMNPMAFFHYLWAKECLRVLKPGGHLLAFSSTRTYHRLVQGIEDAGFEIRDSILWCYGQGFPKSRNLQNDLSEEGFTEEAEKFAGFGTALKPAVEPICLARKPLSEKTVAKNVLKHGTGGLNIDGCRVEFQSETDFKKACTVNGGDNSATNVPDSHENSKNLGRLKPQGFVEANRLGRFPANLILDEEAAAALDEQTGERPAGYRANPSTQSGSKFQSNKGVGERGYKDVGGASRFFMVIKEEGCGYENTAVDDMFAGKKMESKDGDLSTDGFGNKPTDRFLMGAISITEMETHLIMTFPILNALKQNNTGTCIIVSEKTTPLITESNIAGVSLVSNTEAWIYLKDEKQAPIRGIASIVLNDDSQNGEKRTEKSITSTCGTIGASRFMYVAKASASERNAGLPEGTKSSHPTVKPIKLMTYLCKLITPPGGTVLDPFMGSGSTGVAALNEGFKFVGIELNPEYMEIAKARLGYSESNDVDVDALLEALF